MSISDMLNYLDGYPVELPCRYANRVACYTKVYIISNISLEQQYPNVQAEYPETWNAFRRRIKNVQHITKNYDLLPDDPDFDPLSIFGNVEV